MREPFPAGRHCADFGRTETATAIDVRDGRVVITGCADGRWPEQFSLTRPINLKIVDVLVASNVKSRGIQRGCHGVQSFQRQGRRRSDVDTTGTTHSLAAGRVQPQFRTPGRHTKKRRRQSPPGCTLRGRSVLGNLCSPSIYLGGSGSGRIYNAAGRLRTLRGATSPPGVIRRLGMPGRPRASQLRGVY
jgi:hypothetical protein